MRQGTTRAGMVRGRGVRWRGAEVQPRDDGARRRPSPPPRTLPPTVSPPLPVTLFDRHLARRLLGAYAAFVLVLIPVFVVLHYVEYVDDMLDGGAKMADVFRVYYPNYIPEIVRLTSPLALFLAVVFVTGRLAQSNQLMALSAAGVSLWRLLRTYAAIGLVVSAALFVVGGWLVPPTQRVVAAFDERYLNADDDQSGAQALFRQNAPGQFVSAERYERSESTAYRVSFVRFDGNVLVARLDAAQMRWLGPASGAGASVRPVGSGMSSENAAPVPRWRLGSVVERRYGADGMETRTVAEERDTVLNLLPRDFAQSARDAEAMTVPEARAYVAAVARTGSGAVDAPRVAYLSKYAYPMAHVVLVLLGVPFAARRQRGGQTVRIAVALFVACVYLAAQRIAEPLGANGRIDPLVAVLAPHALFLLAAFVGLWRASRV